MTKKETPPIKITKLLQIIHYHPENAPNIDKAGVVSIGVKVVANKPCIICVYEVAKEKE